MKLYCTEVKSIDPLEVDEPGKLHRYGGPEIKANSFEEAETICKETLGYCKVIGVVGYTSSIENAYNGRFA